MGDRDPNNIPMCERWKVVPTRKPAIVQPPLGDNFAIKGYFLQMIHENRFDGGVWADPYEHVSDFLRLCDLFTCGTDVEEAVRLRFFPFSLTGESKNWYNELEPESITTWEQMREKFLRRFFPPVLVYRLLNEIVRFQQHDSESLVEAWLRFKKMLKNCHGHELSREQIMQFFYNGLDSQSAAYLDATGRGRFSIKSTNAAYRLLEDKIPLFRFEQSRTLMVQPAREMATSVAVSILDAFSRNVDNQFRSFEGKFKELLEGGLGNHVLIGAARSDLGRLSHQKFVSVTSVENLVSEFKSSQNAAIDTLTKQIESIMEQNQNNQQASVQDIESHMDKISNKMSSNTLQETNTTWW